jgi:hypothetical protein
MLWMIITLIGVTCIGVVIAVQHERSVDKHNEQQKANEPEQPERPRVV